MSISKNKNLIDELIVIFKKIANIDFSENNNLKDKNLFGREFNIQPRDLVLILYEIERTLNIQVPEEEIVKGNFNTFNNIEKILKPLPYSN